MLDRELEDESAGQMEKDYLAGGGQARPAEIVETKTKNGTPKERQMDTLVETNRGTASSSSACILL